VCNKLCKLSTNPGHWYPLLSHNELLAADEGSDWSIRGCQVLVSFLSYGPSCRGWKRPRLLPSAARVILQTNRRFFKLLNGLGRPRILLSTGEKLSLLFSRIEALLEESAQLDMSSQRVGLGAPALIEYKNMRFLITDRPNLSNLATYVQVRHVLRPRGLFWHPVSCFRLAIEATHRQGAGAGLRTHLRHGETIQGRHRSQGLDV
jgi:hypothetical protein